MNRSFVKELVLTNYFLIGSFALIIILGNLFYGGTVESWTKSFTLLITLALAFLFKIKRIKSKGKLLDERLQLITYRAITIGFYFMLSSIFWFFTKEMVVEGQVSVRTIVELIAGVIGYIGSFLILAKKY
ncbi:MAG: hypothetical protein JM58_03420 [Peptococcaceae bacterium BICA1-8]|nr:MAG: hypothetical protein JM58_03420 [Peptococcaceae bacterium BICA1-8]